MTIRGGADGAALQSVASRLPYLAPALRQVGEYLLASPATAQGMTISELAAACGVAESTVSRFVREVGLTRYQDLRVRAAEAALLNRQAADAPPDPSVYGGIEPDEALADVVAKVAASSERALRHTATRLNPEALNMAARLVDAADVVMFVCMGSSSIAAEDGVMRLTRAGKKCLLFRDQSLQVMTATIMNPRDLVIGLSDSGESMPVIDALRLARSHGARTIAITSAETSSVVEHADVALYTSHGGSPGEVYGETMTSKWGQVLVMDVLYAALASRNYERTLSHLAETYAVGIQHSRAR